jgi:Ca-activated chloride channel homolog
MAKSLLLLLALLACATALKPNAMFQRDAERIAVLRADAKLVLVPVTVFDRRGATVNNLDREHFTVLDGKVPQPIVSFGAMDAPCSVGIILDISGSMKTTLGVARAAVQAFLETAGPGDDFFLLSVSTRPDTMSAQTSDTTALRTRVALTHAGGSTALIDTIYLGLHQIRSTRNSRRALLIVSDGGDNHSAYSKDELMRAAVETDIQIYTVAVDTSLHNRKSVETVEDRRGLTLLEDLAERTGGLCFSLNVMRDARPMAAKVSMAVRNQYVIGFQPLDKDRSGKWHAVRVKVNLPNARVYARNGYYTR